MAHTLNTPYVELKQLDKNRKEYALEIFGNKVTDVFSFIKLRAKPEQKDSKSIIKNSINLGIEINIFVETLQFLKEEKCINIHEDKNIKQIEYFDVANNLDNNHLFKEHEKLPYWVIKVNKRNFNKFIKRDFCTEEYFFEKNKDRKNTSRVKTGNILKIIGIVIAILIPFIIYFLSKAASR